METLTLKNIFMTLKKVIKKVARTRIKKEPEFIRSSSKLTKIDEKKRDKMLFQLCDSDNADIKKIAREYMKGEHVIRTLMRKHYEVSGSEFIQAVFKGNRVDVLLLCSVADLELLK